MQNKTFQISSLGSADKGNQEYKNLMLTIDPLKDPEKASQMKAMWDNSPNNPIIQGFQGMFKNPKFAESFDTPEMQMKLFDADNIVKGQSGIYRTQQDGLGAFGSDIDGKPLYAFQDLRDDKNPDLGKNKLYTAGTVMQQLGAFEDDEEADKWAKFTSISGDSSFMGALNGLSAQGDKKGAVNLIMQEFGYPEVDSLEDYEDKDRAFGTAFSAYNFVENIEKMSPSQQSLSLSTMGMMSYKFKDGSTLQDRALVKDADGNTAFNLSDAFNLAGSGFDVMSMQKNWDQLSAYQQITYGKGTPSQLAATGKRNSLLGDPSMGGSAVYQSDAELGRLGFSAIPSAGMGAIVGNEGALPDNYEVVGAGDSPGQVIAVPKGLSFSTATINGSPEIRSLNNTPGVKKASIGAFKTHQNWLPNKSQGNLKGTSFATGLGQSGALEDPYLRSSMATTSVYGNTVTNKPAPLTFDQAVAQSGTASKNKQPVNLKEMSKKDPQVNTAIKGTQAVVNTMAKMGNETAGEASSYVNAAAVGKQLYDVMTNKDATNKQKAEAVAAATKSGVNIAAKAGSETAGEATPYIAYAMAAYNASKIIGSDMSDEDKAKALRHTTEDTVAAYYTLGVSAIAQSIDRKFLGGQSDKLRGWHDKNSPVAKMSDKLTASVIGSMSGDKSKEQSGRDSVRELGVKSGLVDKDKWTVTLSDGSTADVGIDGHGGKHEFTFGDKVVGENRELSAYDVDYTNDLDFSSNMMTNSLVRMMSGGKGVSIDQVAGQLGNAALGKVGFGKEMNEENFNYVRDNVRGFFFKQGVQTKEDAYALSNQMIGEGRITEMDGIAMQQGINMVFDDGGYDTAQTLMSGRWKGLEVAADIPHSPGPNYNPVEDNERMKPPEINVDGLEGIEGMELDKITEWKQEMNAGTYGGNKNTDIFTRSIIKYKDPWSVRNASR